MYYKEPVAPLSPCYKKEYNQQKSAQTAVCVSQMLQSTVDDSKKKH